MGSLIQDTGRDRYFEQRTRELAALLDPATGMLADRFARTIPCPLCRGGEHARLFTKNGFTFVRCVGCDLVFSNPQVDENLVIDEYRHGGSNDTWVDVLTSERQLEQDRLKFGEILAALEPFRGGGRLLDVGCSIGLFLHLAQKRGWTGTGIEFGERAVAFARDTYGIEPLTVPLAEAGFEPEFFDAIALLSLLEHINDPRAMLADVRRVLRPGGALFIIVPNVASLACRVLHARAATFDGRNHLVYFSPQTLSEILRAEGFEIEFMRTRVSSLTPVLEWLTYNEPYSDADVNPDPLVRWLEEDGRRDQLEALLNELQLGYKLHCLARRAG